MWLSIQFLWNLILRCLKEHVWPKVSRVNCSFCRSAGLSPLPVPQGIFYINTDMSHGRRWHTPMVAVLASTPICLPPSSQEVIPSAISNPFHLLYGPNYRITGFTEMFPQCVMLQPRITPNILVFVYRIIKMHDSFAVCYQTISLYMAVSLCVCVRKSC